MPDAVVVGAGPNGLVAANYLADAGWSVSVLEAAGEPGGAVRTGELTVPGFRHDLFSAFYPLALASPALADLRLEEHGLRWCHAPLVLAHPLRDGRCASLSRDIDETAASLDAFSPGDGDAWKHMVDQWELLARPFLDLMLRPFPPVKPAVHLLGRLGALGALRLVRHALLPVRTMAGELFDGEGGPLLLGGSALHTDLSPEAAGSGLYGWLLSCLGQQLGFPVPEGGASGLTDALVARLAARGGTVHCNTPVTEIVVRHGRAVGVKTRSGDTVDARRAVLADVAAPVLYGDLVAPEHLPAEVLHDLERFQWDMATVKLDWALDAPVPWQASEARRAGTVHIADDFDNLTEFAAQIAMGQLPARPFLLFGQQSTADPTRSPLGSETAWAYTHVPRRVRADAAGMLRVAPGATGDPRRDDLGWLDGFVERMESRVEALAPGFRSHVLGRHVFSPAGLQSEDGNLVGGAIGGGTAQPYQQLILRPVPGSGRPETPIAGLYLASASAHPGAGVHGASGANAARAALLPFSRSRSVAFGRGSWRRSPAHLHARRSERMFD
ncbi:MAG: FAD-dependent oxidoreductase [Acidimicrobiaceae bacterium]|nr:FAD-dependent oxidoreductase [Acidimicrobiaceae bacterium]